MRLIRPVEGERDFVGALSSYENGVVAVLLDDELEMTFSPGETAFVRLYEEF